MRQIVLAMCCALATGLFGLGLASPLTPSYGLPSLGELLVFAGLPIALLLAVAAGSRSSLLRPVALAAATVMTGTVSYLLWTLWDRPA